MPNIPISITISDGQARTSVNNLKNEMKAMKAEFDKPIIIKFKSEGLGKIQQDFSRVISTANGKSVTVLFQAAGIPEIKNQLINLKDTLSKNPIFVPLDIELKVVKSKLNQENIIRNVNTELQALKDSATVILALNTTEFDNKLDNIFKRVKSLNDSEELDLSIDLDVTEFNTKTSAIRKSFVDTFTAFEKSPLPIRLDLTNFRKSIQLIRTVLKGLSRSTNINVKVSTTLTKLRSSLEDIKKAANIKVTLDTTSARTTLKAFKDQVKTVMVPILFDNKAMRKQLVTIKKTLLDLSRKSIIIPIKLMLNRSSLKTQITAMLKELRSKITTFKNNNPIRLMVKVNKTQVNAELRKIKEASNSLKSVTLRISLNSKSVLEEINKIQRKLNELRNKPILIKLTISSALIGQLESIVRVLQRLGREAGRVTSSFSRMNTRAVSGANKANKAYTGVSGSLRTIGDDIQRILAVGFGVHLARQAIIATNEFISYNNALTAIVETTENANRVNAFLQSTAQRLGTSYRTLTTEYTKFIAAGKEAAITAQEFNTAFTAVAETAVVLNFTAEQTKGIFKALTQIMSKGKVQAEELRGQLGEHLFGAFELVAQGMNETTESLDALLKKGQISSADLITSLPKALIEAYGEALPRAMVTGRAEFQRFVNDFQIGLDNNREAIDDFLFQLANMSRQILEVTTAGSTNFSALETIILGLAKGLKLFGAGLNALLTTVKFFAEAVINTFENIATKIKAIFELISSFKPDFSNINPLNFLTEGVSAIGKAFKNSGKDVDIFNKKLTLANNELETNTILNRAELRDSIRAIGIAYEEAGVKTKDFRAALIQLRSDQEAGVISLKEQKAALAELVTEFNKTNILDPELSSVFTKEINRVGKAFDKEYFDKVKRGKDITKRLQDELVKLSEIARALRFGEDPESTESLTRAQLIIEDINGKLAQEAIETAKLVDLRRTEVETIMERNKLAEDGLKLFEEEKLNLQIQLAVLNKQFEVAEMLKQQRQAQLDVESGITSEQRAQLEALQEQVDTKTRTQDNQQEFDEFTKDRRRSEDAFEPDGTQDNLDEFSTGVAAEFEQEIGNANEGKQLFEDSGGTDGFDSEEYKTRVDDAFDHYESRLTQAKKANEKFNGSLTNVLDKSATGVGLLGDAFEALSKTALGRSKEFGIAFKAIKIVEATIAGAVAAVKAYDAAGGNPYLGAAYAATVAIATGAQIATIASAQFAEGGTFTNASVTAASSIASNQQNGTIVDRPTNFPLNNGVGQLGEAGAEAIIPLKRGKDGKLGVGTDQGSVDRRPEINNNIVNVIDPDLFEDFLNSPTGEDVLINVINRNAGAVSGALQS